MGTRRSVLAGLLAAPIPAVAQALGDAAAGAAGVRVRRNLAHMAYDDPDLVAFRTGVAWMKANPGPLSWATQRQVHAAPWNHHNSWRFLPWHRLQVYYLERIIARVSGKADFAMPYWNWSDDHAPAAFFRRASPLYDPTRTITASTRISSYLGFEWDTRRGSLDDFWSRTDNGFSDFFGSQNITGEAGMNFAGSAEQYGHNLIHLFVGGRMRNLTDSTLDPIFFAHHSNVDRQWAIWSEIHGADNYPAAWGQEPCTGYVDADGYLSPVRRAAEAADTRALGYTYDDLTLATEAIDREQWPGQPEPDAQRLVGRTLQMERVNPGQGRIFVPPTLLANLRGAFGPQIDVAAFLQVVGMSGYTVRMTSRSLDGRTGFAQDAIFAVPMGQAMAMTPVGHRAQLKRLVPRDAGALYDGFWIEAEARPLRGERAEMLPSLLTFTLDYRAQL